MGLLSRFFGPPSQEKFAQIVIRTLRGLGDRRVATYDPSQARLAFTVDGKDNSTLSLANIHLEYCRLPKHERTDWLKRTCIALLSRNEIPDEFADAAPDLRPSLRPRALAGVMRLHAELADSVPCEMASIPVSEHLVANLAYDLPNVMSFVTEDRFQAWGVSSYEAFETARHNLHEVPSRVASLADGLLVLTSGDAYDATRMLQLDMIRSFELQGAPLAMPVTRDCLVVTGVDDLDNLGRMAALAESMGDDPRPLCSIAHRLEGDQWEPWMPPADHPHYDKFKSLEIRNWGRDYTDQKDQLDRLNAKQERDVFVATFGAVANNAGQQFSWCVWTKGIASWLPKTDRVGFHDPADGSNRLALWDRAEQVVGHLMRPLDYYPPRWDVEGFPTNDEFQQMCAEKV